MDESYLPNVLYNTGLNLPYTSPPVKKSGFSIWFMVIVIICIIILFGLVLWSIFRPSVKKSSSSSPQSKDPTFDTIKVNGTSTLLGDVIMGESSLSLYGDYEKSTKSLTVNYDEIVNGNSIFNGSSTVNGLFTAENLYLSNSGIINGSIDIRNNLGVTGTSNLYGNANIKGNLGVTGAATFYNNTNIGGSLGVTGAATFYNNTNIGGSLGVTGAATFYNNTNIGGSLGVTGNAIFYNNVTINGNLITIGSDTKSGDLDILGNLGVSGTIGVTGAATFYNNTNIAGNLGVTGASNLYGSLNVIGNGNTYTMSIPGGSNELTNNFKLSNGSTTIMNAKPNGNQVHFMNGSSSPILLIGNTGPFQGATGARVYDDTFNKPPSVESPYFQYLFAGVGSPVLPVGSITAQGTGTFNNLNVSGTLNTYGFEATNLTVTSTSNLSTINAASIQTSGSIVANGTLGFAAPSIVNTTLFEYIFSSDTPNFAGNVNLGFPYGKLASGFTGTNGTYSPSDPSNQIITLSGLGTNNAWKCPTSGLWYVTATMLAGDSTDGKFCAIGNGGNFSSFVSPGPTGPSAFPIATDYNVEDTALPTPIHCKIMTVSALVPIANNDVIVISSLSGTTSTFFYNVFSNTATGVTYVSNVKFRLISSFTNY